MLGGDHGALDHEHVEAGVERELVVVAHPLRRHRARRDDALGLDLPHALGDQLRLDRLLVDLLHLARGLRRRQLGDPLELRVRVLVAGPEALEVEHREPAELADDARPSSGETTPSIAEASSGSSNRYGPEHPGDVDVVGVARPPRRHDRDVVEPVGPPTLLALADLELHQAILDRRRRRIGRCWRRRRQLDVDVSTGRPPSGERRATLRRIRRTSGRDARGRLGARVDRAGRSSSATSTSSSSRSTARGSSTPAPRC